MAFLSTSGKWPPLREKFTILVMSLIRISIYSFTKKVGEGSNRQDFVGHD